MGIFKPIKNVDVKALKNRHKEGFTEKLSLLVNLMCFLCFLNNKPGSCQNMRIIMEYQNFGKKLMENLMSYFKNLEFWK